MYHETKDVEISALDADGKPMFSCRIVELAMFSGECLDGLYLFPHKEFLASIRTITLNDALRLDATRLFPFESRASGPALPHLEVLHWNRVRSCSGCFSGCPRLATMRGYHWMFFLFASVLAFMGMTWRCSNHSSQKLTGMERCCRYSRCLF
ncbi:hypothetical protein BXZ70DRAFT_85584 [Cristinia sonorae]|uniref:Uncharacterized protein n=1 Tax=Cristinia sonorae TaxID=1940300 RepID=A0A8K0XQX1_9AGAR|nr:hypothetical protein BXZ70DRAFT_85584 [Cristinia sonorae]